MTATTITAKISKNGLDNAPVLPSSKVPASAIGKLATIPENIIKDMPFPTPRCVICSPNHIKNIVPPTMLTTVETLKDSPGCNTTPPLLSSPTAIPYPCIAASITVPYLVYCMIFLLPASPSFFICSRDGTDAANSCIMMDAEI